MDPTDSLPLRQLITLGIAGHPRLGGCRSLTGPGPKLHPITLTEVQLFGRHPIQSPGQPTQAYHQ